MTIGRDDCSAIIAGAATDEAIAVVLRIARHQLRHRQPSETRREVGVEK